MADGNVVTMDQAPERRWFDSFINLLAGLGVPGRDKLQSQQFIYTPLSVGECEMAYRSDWLSRKAVQIPAWDMTRQWRHWEADPDQITLLEKLEQTLFLQQKVQRALVLARLYGGAAIVIGVDGAGNPEEELNTEFVFADSLKWLHVVSMNNISIGPVIYDITSKYYGQPEYYTARNTPLSPNQRSQYQAQSGKTNMEVQLHPSRVVKFIGADAGDTLITQVWGDSVLQAVQDAVKSCGLVVGSLATLVAELKLDVIKIPNLSNILSTDAGTKKVVGRFQAANAAKSVINTVLLDSNEEWQRVQAQLSGVDGLIATYLQIVAGAVDIPAGRFLGLPHRGLNVTGDADFRNYYDRLASEQNVTLTPAMTVLDEVLIRSALGEKPDNVTYEWNSLWQLSDGDKADIALKKAQTYQIDVMAAQIPPVALGNARVNQLIEDGFYPGLEQALEDSAAEGDTIEEQNAPAPTPPALAPFTGQQPPPDGSQPPPPPSGGGGQTGQLPPPSGSGLPGTTGDSLDDDDDDLDGDIEEIEEDAWGEAARERSIEVRQAQAKGKAAAKGRRRRGGGCGGGGGGGGGGRGGGKAKEEHGTGAPETKEHGKTYGEKAAEQKKKAEEKEQKGREREAGKQQKQAEREHAKGEKEKAKAEKEKARAQNKAEKAAAAAAKKGAAAEAKAAKAEAAARKKEEAAAAKQAKQEAKGAKGQKPAKEKAGTGPKAKAAKAAKPEKTSKPSKAAASKAAASAKKESAAKTKAAKATAAAHKVAPTTTAKEHQAAVKAAEKQKAAEAKQKYKQEQAAAKTTAKTTAKKKKK